MGQVPYADDGEWFSYLKLLIRHDLADVLQDEVSGDDLVLGAHPPPLVLRHELLKAGRPLMALYALVLTPVSVNHTNQVVDNEQINRANRQRDYNIYRLFEGPKSGFATGR